jgi:hypothetical protein
MPVDTPRDTVAMLFAAIDRGDWTTAAAYIDSPEAVALRRQTLTLLAARIAHRDATRRGTAGVVLEIDLDSALLLEHGAARVSPLRGRSTVAEIAALQPEEFVAGAMQITQELLNARPGDLPGRPLRRIEREEVLDEYVVLVHYSASNAKTLDAGSDGTVLRVHKRRGRWYVVPNGDVVSPMLVVLRLVEGVGRH